MKDSNPLQIALAVIALLGIGVGIGAVTTVTLLNSPLRAKEVSVGPVSYEIPTGIPTSQPQTPVIRAGLPTPTTASQGPSLHSLGTIRVFGNSNQGVQIQVPRSGIYRFAYRSGAYSTYPVGRAPENTKTWLTAIIVFRGNRALWDGTRIKHESALLRLADTGYWSSADEAERSAQGQYLETILTEGEILTLIGVDHFDAYADNPGQVVIEWLFVQY